MGNGRGRIGDAVRDIPPREAVLGSIKEHSYIVARASSHVLITDINKRNTATRIGIDELLLIGSCILQNSALVTSELFYRHEVDVLAGVGTLIKTKGGDIALV